MVTYIGNRCIMTPEGIWSSTKSYEALSLVSHQTTGDGYVSRRAVPTGVDISDDTYWVKMTDFNVQLAAAQAAAEKAEEDAAAALAGVEGKVDATKIITSKEALLALLETGYIADATLVRQLYNELNGKTDGLEELLDSSSQVPGVTSGEKFVGYSNLYKFGSLYVLDILVVANNGYAVNDVVASLPVTIKNNIAAGRYLTSSNGAAMQIAAIGNQVTAQNANPTPGTYGGIVVFFAN